MDKQGKLIIERVDDECNRFYVGYANENEVQIAYVNHDEHGWSGMEAVERALTMMARAFSIEVIERDGTDESEVS